MLLLDLPCFLNMADMSKFLFWQHAFIPFLFCLSCRPIMPKILSLDSSSGLGYLPSFSC